MAGRHHLHQVARHAWGTGEMEQASERRLRSGPTGLSLGRPAVSDWERMRSAVLDEVCFMSSGSDGIKRCKGRCKQQEGVRNTIC